MLKWKILRITAILIGCGCILLVLAAPLPGEVEGCSADTKTTEEVVYIDHCVEYCEIHANKEATECDIFDGKYSEDELRDMCFISHRCSTYDKDYCSPRCDEAILDPALCPDGTFWHPFISVSESEACLNALRGMPCSNWGPDPAECSVEVICDQE